MCEPKVALHNFYLSCVALAQTSILLDPRTKVKVRSICMINLPGVAMAVLDALLLLTHLPSVAPCPEYLKCFHS